MGARITPVSIPVAAKDISPHDLSPGDVVTTKAKAPSDSLTVLFNTAITVLGAIMAFATTFRAMNFAAAITSDVRTQNNINLVVLIATIIIVLIAAFNTYLRIFKTKQPIALG